ncbi:MAG: hypothetical protein JSV11_03370 [Nitrospiraceae bacterium]|nr:MAG: hypothetical protein JSV11_03370 [Nitrospiraceae bacterium]
MMRGKVILIIWGLLITVLLLAGYNQNAFSCGCGGHSHTTSPGSHYSVPLPVMIVPRPEFEHRWQAKDVVESFDEKNLNVDRRRAAFVEGHYDLAINKAKEAVGFDLSSIGEEAGVYIHTFSSRDDLKDAQKQFLELNEEGKLYTWSFARDNVLLVLTGTIPEGVARQYERALYSMKQ